MHFLATLYLCLFVTQTLAARFRQDRFAVVQKGSSIQLPCQQDGTHEYMYWYLQFAGQGLVLLYLSRYEGMEAENESKDPRFSAARPNRQNFPLKITGLQLNDTAMYYCASSSDRTSGTQAYFGNGTKLTVLEPDIKITRPTVKVLPPSNLEDCKKKKKKLTLVCVATGFYPDHITVFWKLNGANLTSGVRTDDTALRNGSSGPYSITSRLRVPSKKWFDTRNSFTCLTSFYDGDSYLEDEDSIKGVNGGGMDREYFLKSGVTAKLSYSLFIAKSFLYGLFISAVVWKIRSSAAKHYE